MENALVAIAKNLYVRSTEGIEVKEKIFSYNSPVMCFTCQEVPDEVKKDFIFQLNKSANQKTNNGLGTVDYSYDFNRSKGPNDNLAEVFAMLPELPKGKKYCLPMNTHFKYVVRRSKNAGYVSKWIGRESVTV